MCPQPLSSFPKKNLTIHLDALKNNQQYAAQIMRVINIWSYIETLYVRLLCNLLESDIKTTIALYTSVINPKTRVQMIDKAAEKALSKDLAGLQLYKETQIAIKASRKSRNDFAHYIWCVAPHIPDGICLLNPTDHNALTASIEQLATDPPNAGILSMLSRLSELDHIDNEKVMVYRADDLEREVENALKAHELMRLLSLCFHKRGGEIGEVRAQAREKLAAALKSPS